MKIRILPTIILSAAVSLSLNVHASCASETLSIRGYATQSGTAPKRLATATVREFKDSVLTVTVNKTSQTVMIDDNTIIKKAGKQAAASDIKAGMQVRITFMDHSGKKVAKVIEIHSGSTHDRTESKPSTTKAPPMEKAGPLLLK